MLIYGKELAYVEIFRVMYILEHTVIYKFILHFLPVCNHGAENGPLIVLIKILMLLQSTQASLYFTDNLT